MKTLILAMLLTMPMAVQASDIARDYQPSVFTEDNPWYIVRETQPAHDARTIHLEMGIQLERALDVALDELRKVDQSVQDAPRPTIRIEIYRHDGHTVVITGTRYEITKERLIEPLLICRPFPYPLDPECPPR